MRKFILLIITCAVILLLTACNSGSASASSTSTVSQAHNIINYKKFSLNKNTIGSNQDIILHSFGSGSDGVTPGANLIEDSYGNFYGTTFKGGVNNKGTVFKIESSGEEIILYSFSGPDGANPMAGLVKGRDGNFYGTTFSGGANNYGTVFKIESSGQEAVLYSFRGPFFNGDGCSPMASLIIGNDGNFYGTTSCGGGYDQGTVFEITSGGTETVLYSFMAGSDGSSPKSSLIKGNNGNLYGTTKYGGTHNAGTIFKITSSGTETVLYSFGSSASDGSYPMAGLVESGDSFYGTTFAGGEHGFGTVFEITSSGMESVLYSFSSCPDGANPYAGLIKSAGNLYGATEYGGTHNAGTIFRISSSGVETVLYSFESGADGANPQVSLTKDNSGNFYGTTTNGGVYGSGTVFEIPAGVIGKVIYPFESGIDGAYPAANLIEDNNGNFYGTTKRGGVYGYGTVFEIESSGVESVVYSFAGGPDGAYPVAGLIIDSNGNFYGTTYFGGAYKYGTIFKITSSGGESVIHSFGAYPDGMRPAASLIIDNNGNLYGTTYYGGQHRKGTVFEIESSGVETVLYSFSGVDGAYPYASLIIDGNGNLYGTTSLGGTYDAGTVFEIEPANNQEIVLHSFSGVDGETPYASLIIDNNGNLYGTTYTGGANYFGTVFEIESSGVETVLYSFESGSDGAYPMAGLIADRNGNFYGTTSLGGQGYGTVFKIKSGQDNILYSFESGADGASPYAGLIEDNNGNFYGTTKYGGNGYGTIFMLSPW